MDELAIWMGRAPWNGSQDERPWILVEETFPGTFACFPVSSQCYQGQCFNVAPDDPDALETGLTRDSYIHYAHFVELYPTDLRRPIGFLRGDLLRRFREEAGLPFPPSPS